MYLLFVFSFVIKLCYFSPIYLLQQMSHNLWSFIFSNNIVMKTIFVSVPAEGAASRVTVKVPPDVWEGDEAVLNCTVNVNKVDVVLLYWYKNTEISGDIVYAYVRGSNSDTKAYQYLQDRAVGQWAGNVHQLKITKTTLTDEDTYICTSGTGTDSSTLRVNGK